MHLQLPVPLLFAISALYLPSSALPFLQLRSTPSESLVARATYSIIPIDGSGGEGGDSSSDEPPVTVIETKTVVSTQTPTTRTIIESSPPVTSTLTVTADPQTHTVPTTISIIDVKPTTTVITTTVTEDDEPTSVITTSSTPEPTTMAPTSSSILSTITPSTQPSQTATFLSSSAVITAQPTTSVFAEISMPASAPTLISLTSKTYDDGFWHTTYPSWNGTMVRRYSHEQ